MKILATIFLFASLTLAQNSSPAGNRVEWNPSAPDAIKELPDGRMQRTVNSKAASVSIIADVISAKRFVDPPADGGNDVTYVVIGVRNTSQQTVNIEPGTITLRAVGKKERELKQLAAEKVIERAWQGLDNRPATMPAMSGSLSGGTGPDATLQHAASQDTAGNLSKQASEQQTGLQAKRLRDKALLPRELAPGEAVMGMVFFYPYEKKDQLELTVPIGGTAFVFPFAGKKK